MSLIIALAFLGLGGVLLNYGAEWLVRGASSFAQRMGVSSLVIGLTIVAFGTSMPELVTSLIGGSTIAAGNVIGSNLCNIGLILGVTALIMPLACKSNFLKFEMPLMVAVGPIAWLVLSDGVIGRVEGALLLAGLFGYLFLSFRRSQRESDSVIEKELESEIGSADLSVAKQWALMIVGLVLLVAGGELFVRGARTFAEFIGISERVIALTVVAFGTSLPELATCVVAARRGEGDIALGNIVGSNIFNVLGIFGVVSLVRPIAVPEGIADFDVPAMIVVQVLCIPIMITGLRVARREGALLLVAYLAYIGLLFFK